MHVLYHRLTKALALESGTTPTAITAETMQMAIIFTDTLETMKGVQYNTNDINDDTNSNDNNNKNNNCK